MGILSACNSKDKDGDDYEPSLSVAVKSFSIQPNARIMEDLDSVFFSIDLEHGVIFNADSLPKGTAINKLVPLITYPSTVEKAVIEMSGGTTRTGTVDYTENPSDSIDFTGNVLLTLSADNGALSRTYRIKVNVHNSVADSLMWDKVAISQLPSRLASPREQKSVSLDEKVISLIEESDGSFTLASCLNPALNDWQKQTLSLPFTPQVRTLTASAASLGLLAADGTLYTSTDGSNWTATSLKWKNIVGGFGDSLLGIGIDNASYTHDIYPRPDAFTPTTLEDDFPIEGFSNFNSFSSKWAQDPIGFTTGGIRNGRTLNGTWAYDGVSWAMIANKPLPALSDAVVIPYFNFKKTSTFWVQTQYSVMLCLGGKLANGSINRKVYISYDNGVNWTEAESLLQLPSYIPATYAADAIIRSTAMNADLDDNWKEYATKSPTGVRRVDYFIDGSDISWECPYIYLIGGRGSDAALNATIWRAVLARLTYVPVF